jgi:cupin 2 domain-containing protein
LGGDVAGSEERGAALALEVGFVMLRRVTAAALPTGPPPETGERAVVITEFAGVRIELITSSAEPDPVEYRQGHDEWVLLLAGAATLEIAGETHELTAGSWELLPAGTPHRVTRTAAGTRWLAVHAGR